MMLWDKVLREGFGGRRNHPSFGHPSNVRRGETTPSFGHPSNVRRGKCGTAFGAERSEVPKGLLSNLPVSLLIGGKGGCIPPIRRDIGRFTPTRAKRRGTPI